MGLRIADTVKKMPAAFLIGYLTLFIRNYLLILQVNPLPDLIDKALLLTGFLFLFLHVLSNLECYSGAVFLLLVIIGLMGLAYIKSGETSPLVAIAVIIASATFDDTNSLAKMWLAITAFAVVFTVFVYITTALISPLDIKLFTRTTDSSVTIRYGFYFCHPNLFAAIVAMMLACLMLLKSNTQNVLAVLFSLVLMTVVYFFTDSRTPYYLLIIAAILFLAMPFLDPKVVKLIKLASAILPIALLLVVYLLSGPLFSDSIRDLFSARIGLWHSCYINQGISFFGSRFVPTISVEANWFLRLYTTLDSFYASCLFVYGIPFSLSFLLFNYLAARSGDDANIAILFLLFFAEGFTEGHLTNLIFGLPILLMGGGVRELVRICKNSRSI